MRFGQRNINVVSVYVGKVMSIQFAFSTFFQRRFNVVKVISNVGSTLKQRHFARWVLSYLHTQCCLLVGHLFNRNVCSYIPTLLHEVITKEHKYYEK